jgi:hypothetical protein
LGIRGKSRLGKPSVVFFLVFWLDDFFWSGQTTWFGSRLDLGKGPNHIQIDESIEAYTDRRQSCLVDQLSRIFSFDLFFFFFLFNLSLGFDDDDDLWVRMINERKLKYILRTGKEGKGDRVCQDEVQRKVSSLNG